MARKKTFTQVEMHYIESFMNSKSPQEISREMGISVSFIEDAIATITASKAKVKKETLTQTAFKQNKQPGSVAEKYGVTIMSKTASELGDSTRVSKKVGRDDCIHKPKD